MTPPKHVATISTTIDLNGNNDIDNDIIEAYQCNPETLAITSVGGGTQHKVTATNKDAKGIFTIDNMMQSN